jgi:replicative DNA helicase
LLSLARATATRGTAGEPLPNVFKGLAREGVMFRMGQLSLVAAGPGSGKSLLALTLAMRAQVPSLYFSADTDQQTMAVRAGAMLMGWTTDDVENALEQGLTEALEVQMHHQSHVQFNFQASPSATEMESELKAYRQVFGDFPALIVMDLLANLDTENGSAGVAKLEDNCDFLHEIARETGAHVMAVHHVVGEYEDGLMAVPLSGLRGKTGKTPEMVLTLHRVGDDTYEGIRQLGVSVVKHRTGKADPSGRWVIPMQVDLPRMAVTG